MTIRSLSGPALLTVVLVMSGCTSHRTETYDIDVYNGTSNPLTLSLAKDGPPYEPIWATPEDVALESPRLREDWRKGPSGISGEGGMLPPGKTAYLRKLSGQFAPGVRGYLRVYAGDLQISEMLSKSAGSPDRLDLPLAPGPNAFTIVPESAHLKAEIGLPPTTRPQ